MILETHNFFQFTCTLIWTVCTNIDFEREIEESYTDNWYYTEIVVIVYVKIKYDRYTKS